MNCPFCKNPVPDDAASCPTCSSPVWHFNEDGTLRVIPEPPPPPPQAKTAEPEPEQRILRAKIAEPEPEHRTLRAKIAEPEQEPAPEPATQPPQPKASDAEAGQVEYSDKSCRNFMILSLLPLPFGQGFFYIRQAGCGAVMILFGALTAAICLLVTSDPNMTEGQYYSIWGAGFFFVWIVQIAIAALFVKTDGSGRKLRGSENAGGDHRTYTLKDKPSNQTMTVMSGVHSMQAMAGRRTYTYRPRELKSVVSGTRPPQTADSAQKSEDAGKPNAKKNPAKC